MPYKPMFTFTEEKPAAPILSEERPPRRQDLLRPHLQAKHPVELGFVLGLGLIGGGMLALVILLVLLLTTGCKRETAADATAGPPKLQTVLPYLAASGSVVTLLGTGLDSTKGPFQVTVGDSAAQVISASGGQLRVRLPKLAPASTGYTLTLRQAGLTTTLPNALTIVQTRVYSYSVNRTLQGTITPFSGTYFYRYDSIGRIRAFLLTDLNNLNQLTEIFYTPFGQIQEVRINGENGNRFVYQYSGNLVTRVDRFTLGTPQALDYRTYQYNSQGCVIGSANYDIATNRIRGSERYEYDSKGNITFFVRVNAVGNPVLQNFYQRYSTTTSNQFGPLGFLFIGAGNLNGLSTGYPVPTSAYNVLQSVESGTSLLYNYQNNSCGLTGIAVSAVASGVNSTPPPTNALTNQAGIATYIYTYQGCL